VPKLLPLQEQPPPEDADGRPGFWLPGGFYVQHGDTLFVQVAPDPRTLDDPCTFFVQSGNSSNSEEQAWMEPATLCMVQFICIAAVATACMA
jgi:hypothetical protein